MENKDIAERIRLARQERNVTQLQLAQHLNKSASNVSDIERGRVQVSALDLYLIAEALDKPVEYFYGTSADDATEVTVALLRKLTLEESQQPNAVVQTIVRMQALTQNAERADRPMSEEEVQAFMVDFFSFQRNLKAMSKQIDEMGDMLAEAIKEHGFVLPGSTD